MWVVLRKIFGLKINAIIEATTDMQTLIVITLVSKLKDYEVANKSIQTPRVKKDNRIAFLLQLRMI